MDSCGGSWFFACPFLVRSEPRANGHFRCTLVSLMLANHGPDWNIDDLSDAAIYAAIRYLERDPGSTNKLDNDRCVIICASLYVLLLACLGFIWLY